jgi:hypothetical protein
VEVERQSMDGLLVWEKLGAAGVSVWVDSHGELRIDKDAPESLKQLVREHKPEVIAVLKAQEVMNRSGLRLVRLPLGGFALAKPPGPLPEEVIGAIKTLHLAQLPLVHNDEGGRWIPYEEWRRRQPLCDPKELEQWRRKEEAEREARVNNRRRRR